MIKSFKCKETQKIFEQQVSRKLQRDIQVSSLRKLLVLDAATNVEDLRSPPSNHLEKLDGNRKGQYSIRINKQWRVCFTWLDGNAFDVEIVDYH